jgi:hypothetical protein
MISGRTSHPSGAARSDIALSARRRRTRCARARGRRSKPDRAAATASGASTGQPCGSVARSRPPRRIVRCRWRSGSGRSGSDARSIRMLSIGPRLYCRFHNGDSDLAPPVEGGAAPRRKSAQSRWMEEDSEAEERPPGARRPGVQSESDTH